jgi:hypothetical protein
MGRRYATGQTHIDFCEGNGLTTTRGLKRLTGDCTPGKHQESYDDSSRTMPVNINSVTV